MKTINQKIFKPILLGLLLLIISCETLELELLEDPDRISLSQADLDFFLNSNQLNLAEFFQGQKNVDGGMSEPGMEATRMIHMFGPLYRNAYNQDEFDEEWEIAYSTIISNNRALQPLAEEQEAFQHLGIAQVIEAYIVTTLVDYFGDVPYSEAVAGVSNPSRDSGSDVYAAMIELLDAAITNLNRDSASTYSAKFVLWRRQ